MAATWPGKLQYAQRQAKGEGLICRHSDDYIDAKPDSAPGF